MHFNGKIISYLRKCFNSKKIVLTDQRKCFESGFMTFYSVFFMETFSDNENLPQNWVFDYILSGKYYPISMVSKFFITYQWRLYKESYGATFLKNVKTKTDSTSGERFLWKFSDIVSVILT